MQPGVSKTDPAYLLGPKKKPLQWPDGGPPSYQNWRHPYEGKDEGEEGTGGGSSNRLEFSSSPPMIQSGVDNIKKLFNNLGNTIARPTGSSLQG